MSKLEDLLFEKIRDDVPRMEEHNVATACARTARLRFAKNTISKRKLARLGIKTSWSKRTEFLAMI